MTYEKAVNALIEAGFLAKDNSTAAVAALDSPSVEMTYPAWADALVKAGLIDVANKEAAASAMEDAQYAEAREDPAAFDEDLLDAGIL